MSLWNYPVINDSFSLLQATCVIIVAAYLISRSRYFSAFIDDRPGWKDQMIMVVLFGLVSIYGDMIGLKIWGGVVSVRDLGPIAGGLSCGPIVGIGSGIIGASFRMTEGGFTMYSCAASTLLAGLVGGLIRLRLGRFPGWRFSVVFAVLFEIFHMGLALAISRPYEMALTLVQNAVFPMVVANAAGMMIFAQILSNFIDEKRTKAERDRYQSEIQREKAELEVASDIQKSFLPGFIPDIPGFDVSAVCLPARMVGGDYYDFISKGDSLGLVIADVAGKGIPAAIFMAVCRIILRGSIAAEKSIAQAFSESNDLISANSSSGMFVTLFYGVLERQSGTFLYSNAGHLQPLIRRSIRGSFEKLEVTGPAMGFMPGMNYRQSKAELHPQDIMVLYTDGISESVNSKGEQFGVERLRMAIEKSAHQSSKEVLDRIMSDLSEFTHGQEQFDDITAIVLRMN